MGLGDLTPSKGSSSSSSGSSSTSRQTLTGVGPSDFPVLVAQTPYLLIKENDEGELEAHWYPHTPEVEMRYDWYTDAELENLGHLRKHEGWTRWFWTEDSYKQIERRVEEKTGHELRPLLNEDPEKALKLIKRAANQYAAEKREPLERCPVCREKLHVIYDDYEIVDNRRVCTNHTVEELAAADLLG